MARKKSTDKSKEAPKVHPDLQGFDININSFGEVITNYDLDKINTFLNKNVDDKKLRDRDDIEGRASAEEYEVENEEDFNESDEDELPDFKDMDEDEDIR
jgi:hypothetical protein